MNLAKAEWETIREAFRTRDARTLLGLASDDAKRRRLSRLLVRFDFEAGFALTEMHLDQLITDAEYLAALDYLKSIE